LNASIPVNKDTEGLRPPMESVDFCMVSEAVSKFLPFCEDKGSKRRRKDEQQRLPFHSQWVLPGFKKWSL
jgi:hypothetical protein